MALPRSLDLTVAQLLDELAGPVPPGGGSAAAVTVAMAAAVVAMAARASLESWDAAAGAAAQAETLRARAAPLAQHTAEGYEAALAVRDGVAALVPEKRDWEIGRVFSAAAEPPLEIARVAADVAELAAEVATRGEPRVRADAIAAATLAAAAARAAVTLVSANLTAVDGDPRVAEVERLARIAGDAAARLVG
ncbi:MAG TPA: cyclodeaminase/cyclohydrolase family protein [Gaiellaceae bacterium]|nr:cyclodeaminase/cyclohydrolase family protein [Gaiellaceae bacterium]